MTEITAMSIQHVLVQTQTSSQDCQVLVLNHGSSVGGQTPLLQVRKHVEQVHGGDELHHGVPQELQPLIVLHLGLSLPLLTEHGHDADQSVDATLPGVLIVDLLVAILRLSDATVGEGVPDVVRVGPVVLLVAGMSDRLLQQVSVGEVVADPLLQVVQGVVQTKMIDEDR